ncbi:MAG: DUF1772 domain-containing protein [Ktedonobacteraceae bacterium]|nr:DUF1772 domain-containing protein [Ktedonobacteraceae bacterium]
MNIATILNFTTLFFAGLLAGALFIIDYGVGPAVAAVLDEQAQIKIRQAVILSLRILMPAIFILTILLGGATTVLDRFAVGFAFRFAGLLAALISFLFALTGTAPINATVLTWQPGEPPKDWRTQVDRWQQFDRVRTWVAITAFALFLIATALKLTVH